MKVIKGIPAEWGMCSRTVPLDKFTWALSYCNNTIAVGSGPRDIIILNAITGSQTAVLSGHTDQVTCLTFSSDGTSLVSGSDDKTVKLWDIQTGGVVKTFSGHNSYICDVSISVDCTRIASGSHDNTVHLWDIQTGECHKTIKQQDTAWYLSFSPTDPQHQYLMFICGGKVCQWDTSDHQIKPLYDDIHFAFSSDGIQFVSCNGKVVTIRNSDSGKTVAEFNVNDSRAHRCCFSPDNRLVAVAADDTIYIWDITSSDPHQIETLIGHTDRIIFLVFSSPSTLISACRNQLMKFWQIGAPSTSSVMNDPKSISPTPAPIQSITLHVKEDIIITSDLDGVVKTWDISTGLYKASFQTPAEGANYMDVQLSNGRLIFVWYTDADEKINIWDAEKGELWGVDYESEWVRDLRISGDGLRVFCLDIYSIQAWSIHTGEFIGRVDVEGLPALRSLTVDGSRVWVSCSNSKYEGWDFGISDSSPIQLPNIPPHKLHPNGTVSWDPSISGIKDKAGKVVFQLPRGFARPGDVQWNGQHLVICFSPKEVFVLDLSHLFPQ